MCAQFNRPRKNTTKNIEDGTSTFPICQRMKISNPITSLVRHALWRKFQPHNYPGKLGLEIVWCYQNESTERPSGNPVSILVPPEHLLVLWRFCDVCVLVANTCLLVLIWMHWQQGSNIESKVNQLYSFAECRIRTQCLWNRISRRLNACWQTDWAVEEEVNKPSL